MDSPDRRGAGSGMREARPGSLPSPSGAPPAGSPVARRLLLLVTAAGLAVDGYVHWHLAARFDSLVGRGSPHLSQGTLFRVEAVLALAAMLFLLLSRRRAALWVAFAVAAGGVAAVLVYRYVDLGWLGPLPDMYDPTWYFEKTASVVAEAVAAAGALTLLLVSRPARVSAGNG